MNIVCGIVERIVVKTIKYVFSFMYKDRDAIWMYTELYVRIMLLLWNRLGTGASIYQTKNVSFLPR